MKRRTRILSLLLAVLMIVGVMPMSVFAVDKTVDTGEYDSRDEYVAANGGRYEFASNFDDASKCNGTTVSSDNGGSVKLAVNSTPVEGNQYGPDTANGKFILNKNVDQDIYPSFSNFTHKHDQTLVFDWTLKFNTVPAGKSFNIMNYITNGSGKRTFHGFGSFVASADAKSVSVCLVNAATGADAVLEVGKQYTLSFVIDPILKRIHFYLDGEFVNTVNYPGNFGIYTDASAHDYPFPQESIRFWQVAKGWSVSFDSMYIYTGVEFPYGAKSYHTDRYGNFLYKNGAKNLVSYDFEEGTTASTSIALGTAEAGAGVTVADGKVVFKGISNSVNANGFQYRYAHTDGGNRAMIHLKGGDASLLSEGKNNYYFNLALGTEKQSDSYIVLYTTSGVNTATQKFAKGDTIVIQGDFRLNKDNVVGYTMFTFKNRNVPASGKNVDIDTLKVDKDGTITCALDKATVGKLTTDKFTNVALILDVTNNVYHVALDGKVVKENIKLLSDAAITKFKTQNAAWTTAQYQPNEVRVSTGGGVNPTGGMDMDNLRVYSGTKLSKTNFCGFNVELEKTPDPYKVTLGDLVESFYPGISSYAKGGKLDPAKWQELWDRWDTGAANTDLNDYGNPFIIVGNKQPTVKYEGEDRELHFGLSPDGTGSNDYIDIITNGGNDTVGDKGYGGRDFAIRFSFKPVTIGANYGLLDTITRFNCTKCNASHSPSGTTIFEIKVEADGTYGLYTKANGLKIATLPKNEYTDIAVLFDVGGKSYETASNAIYVYIDGKFVATAPHITNANTGEKGRLDHVYSADYGSQPVGYYANSIRINRGNYKTNEIYVKDYSAYYFGKDNAADKRQTNIYAYYDFNEIAVGDTNYPEDNRHIQLNSGSPQFVSSTSISALGVSYTIVDNNGDGKFCKMVDDGNGGTAVQMSAQSGVSKHQFLQVGNQNRNSPYNKENINQYRDFVLSYDVKLGANSPTFSTDICQRRDTGTDANVSAGPKLTIAYNGVVTVDGVEVGSVSDKYFTNVAYRWDASEKMLHYYLNGVHVGQSPTNANFTKFGYARIYNSGSSNVNGTIFDNVAVYFTDDGVVNEVEETFTGFRTGDDGYIYYYDKSMLRPNYTDPNGVFTTDAYGIVQKKNKASLIDWAASSSNTDLLNSYGANSSAKPANPGKDQWGMGNQYNGYNRSGEYLKGVSRLYLWSDMTHDGNSQNNNLSLTLNPQLLETKSYVNEKSSADVKTVRAVDITKWDAIEFDVFTEGYQELLSFIQLSTPLSGEKDGGIVYLGDGFNWGTKTYGTFFKTDGNSTSPTYYNTQKVEANGWATYNMPVADWDRSRFEQVTENPYEYINGMVFYTRGWGALDYAYEKDANGNYVQYNTGDIRIWFKDIYVVDNVAIKSITEIYDVVDDEFIPKDGETSFYGFWKTESGKTFYYGENHKRAVGEYNVYEGMPESPDVTGYNFKPDGTYELLNGVKGAMQDGKTHYYVNGVIQKGVDYLYVAPDGTNHRIDSEGDYIGTYTTNGYWAELPEGALTTKPSGSNYSNINYVDFTGLEGQKKYSGTNQDLKVGFVNFGNADKLNSNRVVVKDNGNEAMKVTYVSSIADNLIVPDKPAIIAGQNIVLEFNLKLGEDWNHYLSFVAQMKGSKSTQITMFTINEYGDITFLNYANSTRKGAISSSEYVNIQFVMKPTASESGYTWKLDGYLNGVKVVGDYLPATANDYQVNSFDWIRITSRKDDIPADRNNNGTIYFENIGTYNTTSATPRFVRADQKINGVCNGAYYVDGEKQSNTVAKDGDTYIVVDANGNVVTNTNVYGAPDGKYYDIVGYVATPTDGLVGGKYYKAGALQTGLFAPYAVHDTHPDGVVIGADTKWFAKADGTVVVNATEEEVDSAVYADIANYAVTLRDGIMASTVGVPGDKYYVGGKVQVGENGVIDMTDNGVANDVIYNVNGDGVLQNKDAVKVDVNGMIYDGEGYRLTRREGLFIENKGAADEYANYYVEGVVVKASVTEYCIIDVSEDKDNSKIYLADVNGNLKKGDGVTPFTLTVGNEEMTYFFDAEYLGLEAHDQIVNGKFWWHSKPATGLIGDKIDGEDTYLAEGEYLYADENGNLLTGIHVLEDVWYEFGTEFLGAKMDGILARDYDNNAETPDTKRFFVNGVLQIGKIDASTVTETGEESGKLIVALGEGQFYHTVNDEGDLYVSERYVIFEGKVYDFVDCVAIVRNFFVDDADDADREEGKGGYRYWENGIAANGFRDEADNLAYDNRTENAEYYEMHFVNGYPTIGEIADENGRVRTYDELGHRTVSVGGEDSGAMDPTKVTVTIVSRGETESKLAVKNFYNIYNTDLTYAANYKSCMVQKGMLVTFIDNDGVLRTVTAMDGQVFAISGASFGFKFENNVTYSIITVGGVTLTLWIENGVYNVSFEDLRVDVEITVILDENNMVHTWKLATTVDATCITAGEYKYECECGATKSEIIEATGEHEYEISDSVDASCTEYGSVTYSCVCDENCTESYTIQLPKVAHNWTEDVENNVAPTCCTPGKRVFVCECGASREMTVGATEDHAWEYVETLLPNCSTTGYVMYRCTADGCEAVKRNLLPATGLHAKAEDAEPIIILVATANATEGTPIYKCECCGKEIVAEKPIAITDENKHLANVNYDFKHFPVKEDEEA